MLQDYLDHPSLNTTPLSLSVTFNGFSQALSEASDVLLCRRKYPIAGLQTRRLSRICLASVCEVSRPRKQGGSVETWCSACGMQHGLNTIDVVPQHGSSCGRMVYDEWLLDIANNSFARKFSGKHAYPKSLYQNGECSTRGLLRLTISSGV